MWEEDDLMTEEYQWEVDELKDKKVLQSGVFGSTLLVEKPRLTKDRVGFAFS